MLIDGCQAEVNFPLPLKSEETCLCDEWWHLFDLEDITVGAVKKYKWIYSATIIFYQKTNTSFCGTAAWMTKVGETAGYKEKDVGEKYRICQLDIAQTVLKCLTYTIWSIKYSFRSLFFCLTCSMSMSVASAICFTSLSLKVSAAIKSNVQRIKAKCVFLSFFHPNLPVRQCAVRTS